MENLTFDQLPKAVTMLTKEVSELKRLLIEKQEQQPIKAPEQLLTVQEAAEFLNLTVPTIYSKVSKGELPVMKRSKRLYFSSTELLAYLKEGRKKSNAEIEAEASDYLLNAKKKGGKL
jgi:excisionase family DNA binding protein